MHSGSRATPTRLLPKPHLLETQFSANSSFFVPGALRSLGLYPGTIIVGRCLRLAGKTFHGFVELTRQCSHRLLPGLELLNPRLGSFELCLQ